MPEQKKLDLEVITTMNRVYLGERGRPEFTNPEIQARQAADYFLKLLDGIYVDPLSQNKKRIDAPKDLVINRALCAFLDYTSKGHCFLYYPDRNIPNDMIRTIALKLIEMIEGTTFTHRQSASRAISVLTNMEGKNVLKSASGTWLEDHQVPSRVPYDADITNKLLIPEAVQYARQKVPFIK